MLLNELSLKARLWLFAMRDRLMACRRGNTLNAAHRWLELSTLEERVLLSASPAAVVMPDSMEVAVLPAENPEDNPQDSAPSDNSQIDPMLAGLEVQSSLLEESASTTTSASSRELVFLDAGVRDAEILLADLLAASEENRFFEIIRLDADRDGVAQISEVLEQSENIDAVHILSHGRDGAVKLGNQWLDANRLAGERETFSQWAAAFSTDADLLLYGCDVAASDVGQSFLHTLGELTGTDVAASSNVTGSPIFGGDWTFEFTTGRIETTSAISETGQAEYRNLLATLTVTTTADVLDGDTSSIAALIANKGSDGFISLREAIIATNNTNGADEIFLSAGNYTLAITGRNEEFGVSGDLDIRDTLVISGADAATTIVDGAGIDRVFDIHAGVTATIQQLTITGGNIGNQWGGGINADTGATVTLDELIVTGNLGDSGPGVYIFKANLIWTDSISQFNSGKWGGGFYNDGGTATLERVTLNNNTASSEGGGIYHVTVGASLSLSNVTISGNSTPGSGGGLLSKRDATVVNSTIAFNTAASDGGIHIPNPGSVTLKNSIVAFNTGGNGSASVISQGFNIDSENSLGLSQPSDQVNTDPRMSSLQNNGGFATTHALQAGSTAINTGTNVGAPGVDARNFGRDASPDIGAFEALSNLTATNEFRVNTTTVDSQITDWSSRGSQQAVAIDAFGNYVVVWSSFNQDGSGWGIYAQRFDATGTAIGGEFRVNVIPTNNQQFAQVTMADDGRFAIVWSSDLQDGSSTGVYARIFHADGSPQTAELPVNTTTADSQTKPSIAMDAVGNFVVIWEGNGPGDSDGIFGQRFTSSGAKLGAEFRVNTTTIGTQNDAMVSMNASGQFVVVWDDGANFYAQRYDSTGVAAGGQMLVQSALLATNGNGSVALADDGTFVVTWGEDVLIFGQEIYVRRYDASGNPLGSSRVVNTTLANAQANPSMAMDVTGNFLIVWQGNGLGDGDGVFAQKYDATGNPVGGEFRINQTTTGTQHMASASLFDLDNFVVVWSGNGPGDSDGVFARQFGTANGNTPPTDIAISNATLPENTDTTGGFSVGALNASDADAGESFTYSIQGGADAGKFNIGGGSGNELILSDGLLDFERQSSYQVLVRVMDSAGNTFEKLFTIAITDQNEAPTVNDATFSLIENSPNGTNVGTVAASDPDVGDLLTFAIIGGNPAGAFAINPSTGEITVNNSAVLNFEANPTFNLSVEVRDAEMLMDTAMIIINLADKNEAPILANTEFSLPENSPNGTSVGTVMANDPDAGDTLNFTIIGGNSGGAFSINSTTGEIVVSNDAVLDFETIPTFTLLVRVHDSGSLSDTAVVTIHLTNQNESPTIDPAVFTIDENSPTNRIVGLISASDPDVGDSLRFDILSGNANGAFILHPVSGVLRVTNITNLNFEATPQFILTVQATDRLGLTATSMVTVNLNDTNESPQLLAQSFRVDENSASGTLVGTIVASDPDVGDRVSFTLAGGNTGNAFSLNAGTGELRVQNPVAMNFELQSQFNLLVRATDSQGLSSFTVVNVSLNDLSEPPLAINDLLRVATNTFTFTASQLLQNDLNPDGEPLMVLSLGIPDDVQLVDNGNQTYTLTVPEGTTVGQARFTYTLQDASGRTSTANVQLLIQIPIPVNAGNPQTSPVVSASSVPTQTTTESQETPPQAVTVVPFNAAIAPFGNGKTSDDVFGVFFLQASIVEIEQEFETEQSGFALAGQFAVSNSTSVFSLDTRERAGDSSLSERIDTASTPPLTTMTTFTAPIESVQMVLQDIGEGSQVWQDLDKMEEDIEANVDYESIVVGTAVTVSSTLTVGYVLWMIRGGMLLGSLLAQMPAWRFIDPLPILEHLGDDGLDDDESLESIIEETSVA